MPEWIPPGAGANDGFATRVMPGTPPPDAPPPSPAQHRRAAPLDVEAAVAGLAAGDRAILARAITLVESSAPAHQALARELLRRVAPLAATRQPAWRIGVTGSPGAGKSTFLEAMGMHLLGLGHRVAVLAVDPSSPRTGGSILGDKTRMERLTREAGAFIRPSPSSGALGGVARKTRETMLICEAAGYDVLLVETVGVGQSEVTVRGMVDCFLLLQIPASGDDLQGIKRGVMELADLIAINKADGDLLPRAHAMRAGLSQVVHYLQPATPGWQTEVMLCSALQQQGIAEIWQAIRRFAASTQQSGQWQARRRQQLADWWRALWEEGLRQRFLELPAVRQQLPLLEARVLAGQLPAIEAAETLFAHALGPNAPVARNP